MNKEDIEFLKALQHEMLTQDNVGQASPRFWVVMQTVRQYGFNEGYSNNSVICGDEGEECETDMDSIYNWLQETLEINCISNFDREQDYYIEIDGDKLYNAEDVIEYLTDTMGYSNYDIVYYKDEERIVPDTMFLTKRECEEHIKNNSYHYTKPHTYAMTAWRSPQVERLYKILENTNWDEI